jgi:hypothetical protein
MTDESAVRSEGEVRDALLRYFVMASEQMVNTPGD